MKTYFTISFLFIITIFYQISLSAQSPYSTNIPDWYNDYDIKFYKIDLEANDTSQYLSGNVTIQSVVKTDLLDTFRFELISDHTIDSVLVYQTKAKFRRLKDIVEVTLPISFENGKTLSVCIFYNGTVLSSGFLSSFSSKMDRAWKIPVTWTLSEPSGAKQWLPCKQFLPDKIDSAWIFITVPKNRKAGSNGLLTAITPLANDKLRFEWKTNYPTAYYLLSFAVADYQDYSFYTKINKTDSVLVQNYIYNRPDYLASNKEQIDQTGPLLQFYSSIFGAYPFLKEKYGHCVAPISGGMEHQTMTTLINFDFLMVAHELAHQWFGDWVTCSTWQDIWINEGFASYAEYLALDSLKSHQKALEWLDEAHLSALQYAEGSVFVPAKDADNDMRIFNYQLSYKKGASIIHMLRYELNNDLLFFDILRNYLLEFKDSVASMHDFQKIVNELSSKNYSWFFDQWYFGKGYPVYDFSWKQQRDTITILSSQTPSSEGSPFFKMSYDIRLEFARGDTTFRVFQDSSKNVFQFRLKSQVQRIVIDPTNCMLKKITNVTQVPDLPSLDDYMEVSPNPTLSELTIRFKSEPVKDRLAKIVDLMGNILIEQKIKRKREVSFDTSGLTQGIYLLYVVEGNTRYIRKIVKLR